MRLVTRGGAKGARVIHKALIRCLPGKAYNHTSSLIPSADGKRRLPACPVTIVPMIDNAQTSFSE